MVNTRFCAVLVIATSLCSCTKPDNSLQNLKVNGPVKKIFETQYGVIPNEDKFVVGEKKTNGIIFVFNGAGNIEQRIDLQPDGSHGTSENYLYNSSNFLRVVQSVGNDRRILERTKYICDERGYPMEYVKRDGSGGLIKQTRITYESGRVVSMNVKTPFGGSRLENLYKDGILTYQLHYSGSGIKTGTSKWSYNEYNDVVAYEYFRYDNSLQSKTRYVYPQRDHYNNWTQKIIYNGRNLPVSVIFREFIYEEDLHLNKEDIIGVWRDLASKDTAQYVFSEKDIIVSQAMKAEGRMWSMDRQRGKLAIRNGNELVEYNICYRNKTLILLNNNGQPVKKLVRAFG